MPQPIHLINSEKSVSMDRVLKGLTYGAKETAISLIYMLAAFGFLARTFGYLDHLIYSIWLFVEGLTLLAGVGR